MFNFIKNMKNNQICFIYTSYNLKYLYSTIHKENDIYKLYWMDYDGVLNYDGEYKFENLKPKLKYIEKNYYYFIGNDFRLQIIK